MRPRPVCAYAPLPARRGGSAECGMRIRKETIREPRVTRRVWVLGSGVLSLLLGLLIWNQWPVSGMWAVGVLVGVDLLSTGISMVVLASRAT